MKENFKIVKHRLIEEIVIEGPAGNSKAAFDYIFNNGYDTQRTGPKPMGKGRYDKTTFQIIACREYGEYGQKRKKKK